MDRRIERDGEIELFRSLLTSCFKRNGRVVCVNGATATGKTELLHCFASEAAREGVRFVMATGSNAEQSIGFGIGRQLLSSALDASLNVGGLLSRLEQGPFVTPRDTPEVGCGASAADTLNGLGIALLQLADREPLVIAVDEAHYADRNSLDLLLYLARRARSSGMLLIVAQGEPADLPFYAELLSYLHSFRVVLHPLTAEGVTEMIACRMGAAAAMRLSAPYYALTGGNPLLVRALIEDGQAAQDRVLATAAAPIVDRAFTEAVLRCLHRGIPAMLPIAQGMAILGESASLELVSHLMDTSLVAADQAVSALTETGLLDAGRFRHQAIRDAALSTLSADRLTVLRAAASRLLFSAGADTDAVARQLVAVGRIPGVWAHDILREAAAVALRKGQTEFAIRCLRVLDRASETQPRRAVTQVMLADAMWRLNPLAAGRLLAGVPDAIKVGWLTDHLAVRGIVYLLWCGRLEEAAGAFDLVAGYDGAKHGEAGELTLCQGWLTYAHPPLGKRAAPRTLRETIEAEPTARNVRSLSACALTAALADNNWTGEAGPTRAQIVAAADQVMRQSAVDDHGMCSMLAALLAMIYADRPDMALTWIGTLPLRTSAVAQTWRALLSWVHAKAALRLGDPGTAETLALGALTEISPESWGIAIGGPLAVLVEAATALGKFAEAETHLRHHFPDAMINSIFGLCYLHARGRYELAVGRAQAALESFQTCGDLMMRWQVDRPTVVPWRSDMARALVLMGDRRRARELSSVQVAMLDQSQARTLGAALRVHALASDLKERRDLLYRVVDLLEKSGDRLELCYAVNDLAQTLHMLGESSPSRLAIRRARLLAEQCRIPPPSPPAASSEPVVPDEDAGISAGQPRAASSGGLVGGGLAIGGLSEAELRVATLAAEGHTNRQIAKKLYITVSTVEQHLTRVYRKLGVRRRLDLQVRIDLAAPV